MLTARYNRDSQLTVVVRAGATNQFDFTIDRGEDNNHDHAPRVHLD
jgi:hypothetical protein